MNRRLSIALLVAGTSMAACGPGASAPTQSSVFAKADLAPDFMKADKVGFNDGDLASDGANDVAFALDLKGPVSALFLLVTDADGTPTGAYQADSLVGQEAMPKELAGKGATQGKATVGIGVYEGGKLVSKPNGALPAFAPGPHSLVLYASAPEGLKFGTYFRVYAQLPDKSLAAGPVVKY